MILGTTGPVPVKFKCSAPREGSVEADTAQVVVDFSIQHCHPDAWKTALTRPKSATAHFLEKPRCGASGFFTSQIWRARMSRSGRESPEGQFREGSSRKRECGVFSRPFYVKGEPRRVRGRAAPRRFRQPGGSAESRGGWVFHCGGRPARQGAWTAYEGVRLTPRVLFIRRTQWKTPGGSSGRDRRQSICFSRGAKQRCMHS